MKCIVCKIELERVMQDVEGQPHNGLAFTTRGHYGSTIFDPISGTDFLELYVCDACVIMLGKTNDVKYVINRTPYVKSVFEYLAFDQEDPKIMERNE